MAKKVLTEEEKFQKECEKKQRKQKRRERWDSFKDGLAEVGGLAAPIFVPVLILAGIAVGSSAKTKADENEQQDLLAEGLGYSGRKDPKFVADMWRRKNEKETINTTYEEVDDDIE